MSRPGAWSRPCPSAAAAICITAAMWRKSMPRRSPLTRAMAWRTMRRAAATGKHRRASARRITVPPASRIRPGANRPISASQYASSASAQSAVFARVSPIDGFQSRASWGSSSWRMRLRANCGLALLESSLHGMPRPRRNASTSARSTLSRGRTIPAGVTGRMPANPAVPAPRRKRKKTVSAWSERVCPRATRSTAPLSIACAKKARRASRAASSRFVHRGPGARGRGPGVSPSFHSQDSKMVGRFRRAAISRTNCSSPSDSSPRRL